MTQATVPPAGQCPRTDSLAVWSLVLGILSFLCCIPFVPAILAIVFGSRSKANIRASGGTLTGDGLAQAGVILGCIGLALDFLCCFIGAIIAILCLAVHH